MSRSYGCYWTGLSGFGESRQWLFVESRKHERLHPQVNDPAQRNRVYASKLTVIDSKLLVTDKQNNQLEILHRIACTNANAIFVRNKTRSRPGCTFNLYAWPIYILSRVSPAIIIDLIDRTLTTRPNLLQAEPKVDTNGVGISLY